MKNSVTKEDILNSANDVEFSSNDDTLHIFYSECIKKFYCVFNGKFMAADKSFSVVNKEANRLIAKYNLKLVL